MRVRIGRFVAMLALALAACAPQSVSPPSDVAPVPAVPPSSAAPTAPAPPPVDAKPTRGERGKVSLYGKEFAGRKTASGALFDPEAMTMAHRTLPFGTRVRVTNLENKRSVEVVVNDRGPFVDGRIADLSMAAARALGMIADGVVDGIVEIVAPPGR